MLLCAHEWTSIPCPASTARSIARDATHLAHCRRNSHLSLSVPTGRFVAAFEDWSPWDMRGNLVTGFEADHYLAFATQEQLRAGVTPKQAPAP